MSIVEQLLERPEIREQIYREIDLERTIQDLKFPRENTKAQWMAVLSMWLGKAAKASLSTDDTAFQKRLKQVAAIAVNALERGFREDPEEDEPDERRWREEVAGLANELGGDHHALTRTLTRAAGLTDGVDAPQGLTLLHGGKVDIDEDSDAAEEGRELAFARLEEER